MSNTDSLINDIHALVAASIKIERDRIIHILEESIKESEGMAGVSYPAKVRKIIDKISA